MIKFWLGPNDDPTNKTLWNKYHGVVIDWEVSNDFVYTDKMNDSDVIFLLLEQGKGQQQIQYLQEHGYTNQLVVVLNLYHCGEHMFSLYNTTLDPSDVQQFKKFTNNKILFVDQNLEIRDKAKYIDVIYYDTLFERQVVYHTQYDMFDLSDRVYSRWATKEMYELTDIDKNVNSKHYLAPMRTYEGDNPSDRGILRTRLRSILDKSKGYYTDFANGLYINPQQETKNILRYYTDQDKHNYYGAGTWWPAHNRYYNDSFVSIYVETIVRTIEYRVVTEKTYDPLIKGNFILPYAYQNFLVDVKNYGFILPDWIDYSYDSLPDHSRWEAYQNSVKKVLDMDQELLYNYYLRDKYILDHNRKVFFNHNRDSLVKKIIEYYNRF